MHAVHSVATYRSRAAVQGAVGELKEVGRASAECGVVLENDVKQALGDEVETGGAGADYGIKVTAA
jgi:hypothetical protein